MQLKQISQSMLQVYMNNTNKGLTVPNKHGYINMCQIVFGIVFQEHNHDIVAYLLPSMHYTAIQARCLLGDYPSTFDCLLTSLFALRWQGFKRV